MLIIANATGEIRLMEEFLRVEGKLERKQLIKDEGKYRSKTA